MSTVLANGFLKKKTLGRRNRAQAYQIMLLNERYLPSMMALQLMILKCLQRPDLVQPFTAHFMRRHLGTQGLALGVFVQNRLVGFRNIYFPDALEKQWNLGTDLGLGSDELNQVVNLQMVCVHPQFRGNRLALRMNRIALDLIRRNGTHHHVCATVSPYNVWNIPILLECGFRIAGLKTKYGGKLRYIVYQDLQGPVSLNEKSALSVRLDDLNTQRQLLDSGYYGVELRKKAGINGNGRADGFDLIFKLAGQPASRTGSPRIP
jgi:hypothetical protein